MTRAFLIVGVIATSFTIIGHAAAKDRYVPQQVNKVAAPSGWDGELTVGASLSLASNSQVIGQPDGTAVTIGLQTAGALRYTRGQHQWRNTLKLAEMFSRTPSIDSFIKTTDVLALDSIYLYHIRRVPWLGPFARLQLDTQIFPGHDARSGEVNYVISLLDGGTRGEIDDFLRISEPFDPLTLKETIGVFAKPYERPAAAVEIKLGFAARQTFVNAALGLDDDKDTPQIELKELRSSYQGGPSLGVSFRGALSGKRITYFADAEVMVPVINNRADDDDRNAFELTNVSIEAGLSVKIFSWASLDYKFKALREPQLLDAFQLQNNLLLTFSYALVKSSAPPKKKAPAKKK